MDSALAHDSFDFVISQPFFLSCKPIRATVNATINATINAAQDQSLSPAFVRTRQTAAGDE